MKTVNQLINELQALKPSLREKPVTVIAPNGEQFEAVAKLCLEDEYNIHSEPKNILITYR